MSRLFPNRRKGSPEQVREFDKAQRELNDNSERERRAGVREETPRYLELNHEANVRARPLSRTQQTPLAHDVREARATLRDARARYRAQRGRTR